MEASSSSSTIIVNSQGVKTATFYGWKYSHYFEVVEEGAKNIRVRCKLCAPSQKTLSSAQNTTSNFKKHLDTMHKAMKLIENSSAKRSREDSAEDGDETPKTKRQCTFSSKSMSATKLLSLLSEYVVEDMLPLSTADSPAFKKLIGGVLAIQVPGRKALTVHLDKVFDAMNPKLKDILEKVNFVSTTADVWKVCNKGFFGMTAHWIDPNTLQRCKAALSCSRLTGRNTYDVFAERIVSSPSIWSKWKSHCYNNR